MEVLNCHIWNGNSLSEQCFLHENEHGVYHHISSGQGSSHSISLLIHMHICLLATSNKSKNMTSKNLFKSVVKLHDGSNRQLFLAYFDAWNTFDGCILATLAKESQGKPPNTNGRNFYFRAPNKEGTKQKHENNISSKFIHKIFILNVENNLAFETPWVLQGQQKKFSSAQLSQRFTIDFSATASTA